jgi:Inner membrane component of T3SS, cytoplasmic domain
VVAVVQTVTSRVVVLSESGVPQGQLVLDHDRVRIGRDPAADLVLPDSGVSWQHALLSRSAGRWSVRDLGSTNGTRVDGVPVNGATPIGPGSRIGVGGLTLLFEGPPSAGHPRTQALPLVPVPRAAGIGVRDQQGQQINNVEGLAYIQHVQNVQHVQQQRESFAREVARTRSKARWFVWLGLVILVLGIVTTTVTGLASVRGIFDAISNQSEPDPSSFDPFGTTVGGVPVLEIGYAATFLGALMIVVGIVLHVVATARRRSVDQRYPMPPPPPY